MPDGLELLRRDRRGSTVAFPAGTIHPQNPPDKVHHNSAIARWNHESKKLSVGAVASWNVAASAALSLRAAAQSASRRRAVAALWRAAKAEGLAHSKTWRRFGRSMENFQDQEFTHGNLAPVSTIVPAYAENAFLQIPVP